MRRWKSKGEVLELMAWFGLLIATTIGLRVGSEVDYKPTNPTGSEIEASDRRKDSSIEGQRLPSHAATLITRNHRNSVNRESTSQLSSAQILVRTETRDSEARENTFKSFSLGSAKGDTAVQGIPVTGQSTHPE